MSKEPKANTAAKCADVRLLCGTAFESLMLLLELLTVELIQRLLFDVKTKDFAETKEKCFNDDSRFDANCYMEYVLHQILTSPQCLPVSTTKYSLCFIICQNLTSSLWDSTCLSCYKFRSLSCTTNS